MGCFSWMFADKNNEKNLKLDHKGYLLTPDNKALKAEEYEGFGEFDGHDAYSLVAIWNRRYLSEHPEFEIPQHGNRKWNEETNSWIPIPLTKRIDEYSWYKYYADMSLTEKEMMDKIAADEEAKKDLIFAELRCIGISIACYDDQNAALPYPIKIVRNGRVKYNEVPASNGDPNQGFF